MVKDTIQAVKAAENDAAKLLKDTAKQQEQLIEEAKQSVVSQKKEMEALLSQEREKVLLEAQKHNEVLMEKTVQETMSEISLLHKQANEKQEEVNQLILNELI